MKTHGESIFPGTTDLRRRALALWMHNGLLYQSSCCLVQDGQGPSQRGPTGFSLAPEIISLASPLMASPATARFSTGPDQVLVRVRLVSHRL
jgi:hypothetical protein